MLKRLKCQYNSMVCIVDKGANYKGKERKSFQKFMSGQLDFNFNYFLDINELSKFKDYLTWIIHNILPQRHQVTKK